MKNWSILCPGPSLNDHEKFIHDKGCSITVNGAILKAISEERYFWAVQDPEPFVKCLKDEIEVFCSTQTVLLTHDNFQNMLNQVISGTKEQNYIQWIYDCMPKKEFDQQFFKRVMFDAGFPWRESTMFMAIAYAILQGAVHIRLYGCDMVGQGYFKEGLENDRTRHNYDRWQREYNLFELLSSMCAIRGIIIERMNNGTKDS